jgi:hypothetical protein
MRPKDWAYGAEFDAKDSPYLHKMAKMIRETEDTRLIEEYYNKCERKYNDHTPVLNVGNKDIEFIQAVKSDDLAVNAGIDQYIRIALNTSSVRWRYIGYSYNFNAPPGVGDTLLFAAESWPRIDTSVNGWARVAGTKMMFGGVIGESVGVQSIWEMGVFNNSSGTTMLNHNVFVGMPLSRTIGRSVFILSSVYQTVPKA